MESPEFVRRRISVAARKQILADQGGACLYCEQPFGGVKHRHGKPVRLMLHWDHLYPYVATANNRDENYAAACHVCNGIKSSHVFQTIDEARVAIQMRRTELGYDW
jgi:5-methylcytosine-specific restriction endonuclease McrA